MKWDIFDNFQTLWTSLEKDGEYVLQFASTFVSNMKSWDIFLNFQTQWLSAAKVYWILTLLQTSFVRLKWEKMQK